MHFRPNHSGNVTPSGQHFPTIPPPHIAVHNRGQSTLRTVRFGLCRPLPGLLSLTACKGSKENSALRAPTHQLIFPWNCNSLLGSRCPWACPLPPPSLPASLSGPAELQPDPAAAHRALWAPLPVGAATASSPPPTSAEKPAATNSAAGEAVSPKEPPGCAKATRGGSSRPTVAHYSPWAMRRPNSGGHRRQAPWLLCVTLSSAPRAAVVDSSKLPPGPDPGFEAPQRILGVPARKSWSLGY